MADPKTSDDGRGGEELNTTHGEPKSTQGDQTRDRPRAFPKTARPGSNEDEDKRETNDRNKDLDANNTD
jgi:hypothetical protein